MHHLGQVVFFRVAGHFINQYIRQQHGEGVVTDQRAGAQHSVAQTFGLTLTDVHDGDVFRADLLHLFQQLTLDPLLEGSFQFETLVEVVFDGVLARVGDQHDLFDTTYWISGLSTTGNISFGMALVAGSIRVPRPATGSTALRTTRGVFFMENYPAGLKCGNHTPRKMGQPQAAPFATDPFDFI